MNKYCIYLRKSRKDTEAELRGEGETLARHKNLLLEFARKQNIEIDEGNIFEEIVSGDSIATRPVMQNLLTQVEQGLWTGVLVVEIERLARGDTMDQGLVAQAFKYSNTKIITPMKTYNPSNEFDEEYFEFGLFMSRREFVTIKRRLVRGREAAAKEGKFVGSIAPYGYERIKIQNDKGYTLKVIPEQAEIIKLIFRMYVYGAEEIRGAETRVGIQKIANILNTMGIPSPRHDYWEKTTLRDILLNPTYAGMIRWGWRKSKKINLNGKVTQSRPRNYDEDCICVKGLHEAIVDKHTFEIAQGNLEENPLPPVGYQRELKNPLAGLIICAKCGRKMVLRRGTDKKPDYIVCHARHCNNVSSPYNLVEDHILNAMKDWLNERKITVGYPNWVEVDTTVLQNQLMQKEKEIATLNLQLNNIHDLLEQGVYTKEMFLERFEVLNKKIAATEEIIISLREHIDTANERERERQKIIPQIESMLESYYDFETPFEKNVLLKKVIDKVVYNKDQHGGLKGVSADCFTLEIFPKLNS